MLSHHWKQTAAGQYSFFADGEAVAYMNTSGGKATIVYEGQTYSLRSTGFLQHQTEMLAPNGETILRSVADKWYGSRWTVSYLQTTYGLVVRNNPMAEWALIKDGETFLAYTLTTGPQGLAIDITEAGDARNQILLHCFLWYIFYPIAHENFAGNLVFL